MVRERIDYHSVWKKIHGGVYGTNTTHKFYYNSKIYNVILNRDDLPDGTTEYSILQQVSNQHQVAPCIRGEIQKDMLYISNVEKHGVCVLPEISSYQGIVLLRWFLRVIKNNHPEVIRSELTDNAKTLCGQSRITLSDLMMITKGRTYYAMAGYKPLGHRYEERYAHNLGILTKLTWKHSMKKIKDLMHKHRIDVSGIRFPKAETGYKEAMGFMFKSYCDEMTKIFDDYLDLIGYKSMYGVDYTKQL